MKHYALLLCTTLVFGLSLPDPSYGYVDAPQDIGDLVFRASGTEIYGRDGDSCVTAATHPGHVGVYIGGGQIVHALGWDVFVGEVVQTPVAASAGVVSFYENADPGDPSEADGVEDHEHLGAKTHVGVVGNPNAQTLRQNIKYLALDQVGEGYDNNLSDQKGPGFDEWICSGLAEKTYESCAGQTLLYGSTYGDESQYAGSLNITPDGFEPHFNDLVCYYQNNVEFSQASHCHHLLGPQILWLHPAFRVLSLHPVGARHTH